MPIGSGNLALLGEAVTAARCGLPVLLLAGTPDIAGRDYTGEGQPLWDALLQAGARTVESVVEAMDVVKQLS